jgi:hypothetical protein
LAPVFVEIDGRFYLVLGRNAERREVKSAA